MAFSFPVRVYMIYYLNINQAIAFSLSFALQSSAFISNLKRLVSPKTSLLFAATGLLKMPCEAIHHHPSLPWDLYRHSKVALETCMDLHIKLCQKCSCKSLNISEIPMKYTAFYSEMLVLMPLSTYMLWMMPFNVYQFPSLNNDL